MSAGPHHGSAEGFVNRNVKTGLILACVAFVFFVAIIAKYWLLK